MHHTRTHETQYSLTAQINQVLNLDRYSIWPGQGVDLDTYRILAADGAYTSAVRLGPTSIL